MLRDRLVYGVNDDNIRRKLLQEKDADLTFQRALSIALGAETADQNLREMKAPYREVSAGVPVKSDPVHRVSGRRATPSASTSANAGGGEVTWHRCGTPGHLAPACRFKDRVCYKCKKKGHLASVQEFPVAAAISRTARTEAVASSSTATDRTGPRVFY